MIPESTGAYFDTIGDAVVLVVLATPMSRSTFASERRQYSTGHVSMQDEKKRCVKG